MINLKYVCGTNTNAMKTQSELKVQKVGDYQYLVLYYKLNGAMIRINTKFRYIKNMHRADLYYNNKAKDADFNNKKILALKNSVDDYIKNKIVELYPSISQKECIEYLNRGYMAIRKSMKETLLDYYHTFYETKEIELQNKPSMKDYKSLENALIDFQTHKNQIFKPQDITPEFIFEFRNFLADQHPKTYKTIGNLNNNTIAKRISGFRTFCRWLEDNDITNFKEKIYSINTVSKYEPDTVALNKDDMKVLIDLKPTNAKEERIIDLFILNCYMGMRWSDLMTINKGEFTKDGDNFNYTKVNEKTKTEINIPVLPTALRLFKKYDWKIPTYTQQYFNRELKTILANHKLFETPVKKKKRQLGDIEPKEYLKRQLIATHTCRRTFITIAISSNVPLNAIMNATGHKNLRTLQKYAKNVQDRQAFERME